LGADKEPWPLSSLEDESLASLLLLLELELDEEEQEEESEATPIGLPKK